MIKKIIISLVILVGVGTAFATKSYDENTTHPAITDEVVDFYNLSFPNHAFSKEEKELIVQGAMDEDEIPRWINHFYDPIYEQGWTAEKMGRFSSSTAMALNTVLLSNQPPLSTKDWATSPDAQAKYKIFGGNRTWQRAVYELAKNNDKEEAYRTLGYILHLVEDMTVPDHTRNDTHPHPLEGVTGDFGSPYEEYSKRYYRTSDGTNLPVNAETLFSRGENPAARNTITDYISYLAKYSNNYFFSKDTIHSDKYQLPKVVKYDDRYGYGLDSKNSLFPLARVNIIRKNGLAVSTEFVLEDVATTKEILNEYFTRLSRQAILNGAGVIKLFFDEVEKVKNGEETVAPPPKEYSGVTSVFAVVKQVGNVYQATNNFVTSIVSAASDSFGSLKLKLGLTPPASSQNNSTLTGQPAPAQPSTEPIKIATVTPPVKIQTANQVAPKPTPPNPTHPYPAPAKGGQASGNDIQPSSSTTPAPLLQKEGRSVPSYALGGGGPQGSPSVANPQTEAAPTTSSPVENDNPTSTPDVLVVTSTLESATTTSPTTTIFTSSTSSLSSTSSTPTSTPDTTPPPVPVLNIQNQTSITSTNIFITAQSADVLSAVSYFDLQYSTNTTAWLDLATSTPPTHPYPAQAGIATATLEYNFSGARGQSYYFRARAADAAGNISDWSATSSPAFVNWSGEVVINEVAWAGTAASYSQSNDEWFELYNNTDQDIDLTTSTGWKIFVSGKQVNLSKTNNKNIPARGYYLFERSSDDTVREIGADAVYTLSGGFHNNGAKLELFKPSGEKADEVDASVKWFAGDSIKYKSMERMNPAGNGSDPANWQSNQGFRATGRSYNGGQIYGSPKRSNFGFIALNYDQEDSVRVLTKANSPYILQYYSVPAGKILNIEPGVVIKSYYKDSKIDIYGTLNALGSADKKIIFTSGAATTSAQDWQGIWFRPNSTGTMQNIDFRYAGRGFVVPPNSLPVSQAIRAENSNLTISDSNFSDNGPLALFMKNSSTTISNTVFGSGNRAIQSENTSLAISNSNFTNFSNNTGPIYIRDKWPLLNNITYSGNVLDMPYLENVTITEPEARILESLSYLTLLLTISASSTLNIEPGVNLYVAYKGIITVNGSLNALGTADKPINFLPYPSSTGWNNIKFNSSTSVLNFVNVKGANSTVSGLAKLNEGAIVAANSNLTISNSNFWDNGAYGNVVGSNNSVLNISNTSIGIPAKGNNAYGILADGGGINLDNVNFNNLFIGLQGSSVGNSLPAITMKNMSAANFVNIDSLWFWAPSTLWAFASST